jgi:uncharacterized protein (TIGR00730 family)
MSSIKSICIYCGSQPGHQSAFTEQAQTLGKLLAENKIRLVYGGGSRGIMGAISKSALDNGGNVLGIIPQFLLPSEGEWDQTSPRLEIIITENMHERKQKMFEESDAFVALPGGIGTLEEIVEMITWAQLGRHEKPIAFLNTNDFWDPMLELIDHMKAEGFIHTANKIKPVVLNTAEEVIEKLFKA